MLLRLSTKYAIDIIRQPIIKQLGDSQISTHLQLLSITRESRAPFIVEYCDEVKMLQLARQSSADTLLPALFLICSSFSLETVFGFVGNDGTEDHHLVEAFITCREDVDGENCDGSIDAVRGRRVCSGLNTMDGVMFQDDEDEMCSRVEKYDSLRTMLCTY